MREFLRILFKVFQGYWRGFLRIIFNEILRYRGGFLECFKTKCRDIFWIIIFQAVCELQPRIFLKIVFKDKSIQCGLVKNILPDSDGIIRYHFQSHVFLRRVQSSTNNNLNISKGLFTRVPHNIWFKVIFKISMSYKWGFFKHTFKSTFWVPSVNFKE